MLGKVMQNGAQIIKNDARMVPTLVQNRFKIRAKINTKTDAEFVIQK